MAKNSIDVYGAAGKTNLLYFDPDALTLVMDEKSPLYDERVHLAVDEGLAANIDLNNAVLMPISVVKNTETGATEVVMGRQRVKATRLANQWRLARGEKPIQIGAYVYRGNLRSALVAIVSENEAREPDTPMGRARKMQILASMAYDEAQIAKAFRCGVSTVKGTLALLTCSKAVQTAVDAGQITATQARQLATLKPDEQREKVKELIAAGDGVKPHERARRQRAALTGKVETRMKTRKQIAAELDKAIKEGNVERAEGLRWVIGVDAAEAAGGVAE
ncbi:ParB/RepB/Spo0J family partition protein [Burkholderia territorii]|uniref:ParB/RepB/Spo0J family partition protein n=1 Tax=Burkholderia territorii TaxID=1503055 RepID=UPI00075555D4|nr:ParB/RepB/Spo0J family partition protein [Burkholderia territorii]KWO62582.1 hypothetical protein WT98_30415 [Burkholderia territorii]